MNFFRLPACALLAFGAASAFATVTVTTPKPNTTVAHAHGPHRGDQV